MGIEDERRVALYRRLELVDRVTTENELLREVFSETRVRSIAEEGFFLLRVPRHHWLRLRAWRAADRDHGRAGSRWWRLSDDELRVLRAALRVGGELEQTDRTLRSELERELESREHEAAGS